MSRCNAADTAGLGLPTRDAIGKLPTILGGQHSQFNHAARDVLIAASLGATHDRHADINADRETVRRQLEQCRLSDTPLTMKAIDGILEGTDCQVACAALKEGAVAPEDPLQALAFASQAAAPPDSCDPCDFIKKSCGCSITKSQRCEGLMFIRVHCCLSACIAAWPCGAVCLVAVRMAH